MTALQASVTSPRRLLVVSTVALWGATFVGLAASLARGKASAVYLGADGMGLIAQLNQLSLLLGTIAVLGLANGSIRLIAEARAVGDLERERRVKAIVVVYPLAAGALLATALALSAPFVDTFLLDRSHPLSIILVALTVPLGMATASYVIVLQGVGELRRLAGANAIATVLGTIVVMVAVVTFGLDGAIAAVALTSATTLAVFVVRERRLFSGLSFSRSALFDRGILRTIYAFGLASVALGVLSSTLDLSLRTFLVHSLGIEGNGLYQPVTFLSTQLFLGLITGLATYLFPSLTSHYARGDRRGAENEVNDGLRLLLTVVVPAVLIIVALSPFLLRLAFSAEFVAARGALGWQLSAEVLRAGAWVLGAVLLPLGLVRVWFAVGIATLGTQAGLAVLLVPVIGLEGMALAYAGAWLVNLCVVYAILRRRGLVVLSRPTFMMLVLGTLLAGVVAFVAHAVPDMTGLAGFAALGLWFAITLRRSQLRALRRVLSER